MKKFFLKLLNFILNIVMVASAIYAMFALVLMFLPEDIKVKIYEFMHLNAKSMATFSVSAVINAAILVITKISSAYSKIALTNTLAKAENTITSANLLNEVSAERTNKIINNSNVTMELLNAVLEIQKVNAERNLKASDTLVYAQEKEAYKKALETIEKAQVHLKNIDNIATVVEKTKIKEVIVEKEVNSLDGRI